MRLEVSSFVKPADWSRNTNPTRKQATTQAPWARNASVRPLTVFTAEGQAPFPEQSTRTPTAAPSRQRCTGRCFAGNEENAAISDQLFYQLLNLVEELYGRNIAYHLYFLIDAVTRRLTPEQEAIRQSCEKEANLPKNVIAHSDDTVRGAGDVTCSS